MMFPAIVGLFTVYSRVFDIKRSKSKEYLLI